MSPDEARYMFEHTTASDRMMCNLFVAMVLGLVLLGWFLARRRQ